MATAARLYGLIAEFRSPDELIEGARRARQAGYKRMDAYTPFPIEALNEALGLHHSPMPKIVLAGGLTGCLGGFGLAYWASVIAYPMNISGKPLNSWPAFIVPTFECTVLVAGLAAVLGMLAVNGLPMPYHPVFNSKNFELASRDRYFLCIEARDKQFDREATRQFLASLNPSEVSEVEP